MTAKNDITGDTLVTKTPTDAYREGYDRIFGKKPTPPLISLTSELEHLNDRACQIHAEVSRELTSRLKDSEETE